MILLSVGPAAGALAIPALTRQLFDAGRRVEVILEPRTRHFVGPAAFAGNIRSKGPSVPIEAIVFAPATAGTLARLAHNLVEGPAIEAYIAGLKPVFVAPDLDVETAAYPAVSNNVELLRRDGCRVIGDGREGMASPGELAAEILGGLEGPLSGLRMVVTAGGTREPIDSVRFVGNRSSGKMGLAIAREAKLLGAEVSVVAANVERREPGVRWHPVETVDEMRDRVMDLVSEADVLVMAAAVSDFKPAKVVRDKIRRRQGLNIELAATGDILKFVRERNPDLFMVGFAATYGDPVLDARKKLVKKGADLMVGNDISRVDIGFGADENEVYIVSRDGERLVPRASKTEIARTILDIIITEIDRERQD